MPIVRRVPNGVDDRSRVPEEDDDPDVRHERLHVGQQIRDLEPDRFQNSTKARI